MDERKKRSFAMTREQLAAFEAADPQLAFKPLTEETAEDFKMVVRTRFSPAVERQVDTLLANPLREYCDSVGDIAYENGEPACVQGIMLRKVYYKQTPYLVLNGSMFAKMPNASPVSVFGVMTRTLAPRGGVVMWFGNTGIKSSLAISEVVPVAQKFMKGPKSWCGQRVALIRPISALWMRFRSNHPRLPAFHWDDWDFPVLPYFRKLRYGGRIERCDEISNNEFEPFWEQLLAANEGLISSRTPDELRWMFGARLKEGRIVMLTLRECEALMGYVVIRCLDSAGKCWSVVDLIAEGNAPSRLQTLLREAVRYLRCVTPAMELVIAGFPSWVQPVIARVFRYNVKSEFNPSAFALYDSSPFDISQFVDARKGWFAGPVDGDAWL